ncbi:MAG TPA: SDR family NAD(P)-dependent oxidoreductase, partial [Pirellulales bacterium]|nr:SDR family NAD(P)-dependent oxidoreductase [Pirellulales bacterium]
MKISGSTFLITGGGSGLGAACARHFVARGGNVVIADVQEPASRALAGELGAKAAFARTDVTDEASVQNALGVAQQNFGAIQGVINCAGIIGAGRVVGKEGPYDLASFSRTIQVNLIGTFNVIRLAAAAMTRNAPNEEQERGVIINTASVAAFDGQVGQAAYSASKGGVVSMTLPIARELARFGIRVVTIAPGVFETAMMAGMPQPQQEALAAQVPFPPRLGRASEFAD